MKITAFLQKKPEVKATNVDIREAFTLWDILNSKYTTKERLLMFNSFAEDPELRLLLGKRLTKKRLIKTSLFCRSK
jgi:hypothetical protein